MKATPAAPARFRSRVFAAVRSIPAGHVSTYGDIAELAGRPRAWRAVGSLLRGCGDAAVPCHRVVAAGGRIGGYGGREAVKRYLLAAEGIRLSPAGRVRDFAAVRWPPPAPVPPKRRSR